MEDHGLAIHSPPRPALKVSDGVANLAFQTENRVNYAIEYTDSLAMPDWQLLTHVTGNGENVVVTDGANHRMRFYRIRIE